MTDPTLLVGFGGVVGALARYAVGSLVDESRFPLSTVLVNVVGSFLLGLVSFAGSGESLALFVGVGVCGAFTTFSTFSVDTVQLVEEGRVWTALVYALGNAVVSIAAIATAWVLVT